MGSGQARHSMNYSNIPIYGLDDFSINLRALTAFGDRPIRLKAYFRYPNETRFLALLPNERKAKIDDWFQKCFEGPNAIGRKSNSNSSAPRTARTA